MGWLFYGDRHITSYADEKADIARICTNMHDIMEQRPIQMSKVGSTWYVAVKSTPKNGHQFDRKTYVLDEDGSYVFAAVFLTKYDDGCFGYKDMDETMGPAVAKAPLSLLSKLSDLVDPECYAHRWRADCRSWAEIPRYDVGDIIKLAKPIALSDGSTVETVECTTYRRGSRNMRCYRDVKTKTLCRLSKRCFVGSVLVKNAKAAATSVLDEFYGRGLDAAVQP